MSQRRVREPPRTSLAVRWSHAESDSALLARPGTGLSDPRREVFLYALMRNLLDVPSIWLPNEGVFIPSYAGRLDYLTEHWDHIGGYRWFDDAVRRGFAHATRAKLTADIEGDPLVWYAVVVRAYQGLLRRLLTLDPAAGEGDVQEAILDRWAAAHPTPRSRRFRLYRLALGLRAIRISLRDPEGFKSQVRGILQASALGNHELGQTPTLYHEYFGRGSFSFLFPENPKVLAYVRTYEDEQVLVVANLSRFSQPCELDLSALSGMSPVEIFGMPCARANLSARARCHTTPR